MVSLLRSFKLEIPPCLPTFGSYGAAVNSYFASPFSVNISRAFR